MCGKAKEIQKLQPSRLWHTLSARPDDGLDDNDYLYASPYYLPKVLKERSIQILKWDNDEGHPIIGGYSDNEEGAIWLPTQEQLQAMLPEVKDKIHVAFGFNSFLRSTYNNDTLQPAYVVLNSLHPNYFCSMNEFWLCYVIKEKYNKIWTGKDWVIIETTDKTNQKI